MKLHFFQVIIHLFCLIGSSVLANPSVLAQVASDESLNTQVTTSDNLNFVIKDGTQAGSNLFHSFREFSIPTEGSVSFVNSTNIQNIFNRVTGVSPSNLDGLLKANGSANVFLLNPNGIIFGNNAALNIGGSFLASTANSLIFEDGNQFSTNKTQTQPLLTVNVPIGLQFGSNPGKIINQSITTGINNLPIGLQVLPNQTLSLIGGEIELNGGLITVPSGQIDLASVAGNSLVSLNFTPEGWQLGFNQVQQYQDIQLSNLAKVDASGLSGGSIFVQGKNITLSDGSKILSNTLGSLPGKNIVINAFESVQVIGDTDIPNLFEPVELASGILVPIRSSVSTTTVGDGEAGDIAINTAKLFVQDGAQITANAFIPGNGNGGDILVNASESIEISGSAILPPQQSENPFGAPGFSKQFFVEINGASSMGTVSGGTGTSGNINLNTPKLTVRDGGVVTTSPFSQGDGGDITVNANEILLSGTSANEVFFSGIFAGAIGNGNSGNLNINTNVLKIFHGARLSAATFSQGRGGNLTLNATNLIEIAGKSATGLYLSSIRTQSSGSGNAGNINITTGKLSISDEAQIAVNGINAGNAGNLSIFADSVILSDRGLITAETTSGKGGNLQFQIDNTLLMKQNSLISAQAIGNADGGNIDLKADFIVALPQENNDIIANAFLGTGGNIAIISQGVFGIQEGEQNLLTNDIDASSEFSLDGTVKIVTPEIDPNQSLLSLSIKLINVDQILSSSFCHLNQNSEFIITGRGGVPVTPTDTISPEVTWQDWRMVELRENDTDPTNQSSLWSSTSKREIITAQGWIINPQGKIELTANPLTVDYVSPAFNSSGCQAN